MDDNCPGKDLKVWGQFDNFCMYCKASFYVEVYFYYLFCCMYAL